jgi:two-component system, NarL family, sensor kinase
MLRSKSILYLFCTMLGMMQLGVCWAQNLPESLQRGLRLAAQANEAGKIDSADYYYGVVLKKIGQGYSSSQQFQVYHNIGQFYAEQAEWSKSKDILETALSLAQNNKLRRQELQAFLQLASNAFQTNDLPQAARFLATIEKKALKYPTELASALNLRAKIHSYAGELGQANQCLERAKNLALEASDSPLAIDVLTQLATNYKNQAGKLPKAHACFQELIKLREKENQSNELIAERLEFAELLQQMGESAQAQAQLLKALQGSRDQADSTQQAEVCARLGLLFLAQKQWQEALKYLKQGLILSEKNKNEFQSAEILHLQGGAYLGLGQKETATQSYREALRKYESIGNELASAGVLTDLTKLLKDQETYSTALEYLQKALDIRERNQEVLGALDLRLEMARIYLLQKKPASALNSLGNAELLARESGSKSHLSDTYHLLADAHAQTGNFNLAYRFNTAHHQLKDEIFSEKQSQQINELNTRYRTRELQQNLEKQSLQKRRAESRLLNYALGAILLVTGLLGLLFFQNYRARAQKRLQKQQMAILEKERESAELRSMISGEENERSRIARELHDGLGTLLATVKLQFGAVQNALPEVSQAKTYQKADALLDEACSEVRKISYNLMPAILQQYGLEYAIADLCNDVEKSGHLAVSFIPYGLEEALDEKTAAAAYRIVQELVKNVLRHADAKEIIVQVTRDEGQLNITVEDDGKGFQVAEKLAAPGIGLQSIQSRVTLLNGQLDIQSEPGKGSTFSIDIPVGSR